MRRRTKGTGSLSLRGNTFWLDVQHQGKRLRESCHTSDRDEAERYMRQRIGEIAAGREITPGKATIADLCGLVIADYKLRSLRNLKDVEWRFRANVDRLLGKLHAARFGAHQVRAYVAARRGEGAANATINRELAIVRRGFALGRQEEPPVVFRSPHIPRLEESDPRQGFIEQSQYEILLAHMPEHLKGPLVIGYHYGLRLGEIRGLRWEQIDFAAGEIRLQASQTKGKAARTALMYGDVKAWMERQRELCKGAKVFCWKQPAKRVEAREKALGSHLKGWADACIEAGMPGLLFHDLRRSAVRNMIRAGIPEQTAMRISGHKTSSVFRRYNIITDGDLKDAAAKAEAFQREQKKTKLRRVK